MGILFAILMVIIVITCFGGEKAETEAVLKFFFKLIAFFVTLFAIAVILVSISLATSCDYSSFY